MCSSSALAVRPPAGRVLESDRAYMRALQQQEQRWLRWLRVGEGSGSLPAEPDSGACLGCALGEATALRG